MGLFDNFLNATNFLLSSKGEKLNYLNRHIKECGEIDMLNFLNNSFYMNSVISGTEMFIRNLVVQKFADRALNNSVPVIVLHSGNIDLENRLSQLSSYNVPIHIVNQNSANYVPFGGVSSSDSIDLILESAPEKFDIKPNARYYLEAVTGLMQANKIPATFSNYLTCPHSTVLDRIDRSVMNGKISDIAGQELKSKLMIGQSEYYKIDSYLHTLQKQMGNAFYKKNSGIQPTSIFKSVNDNGLISLNIGNMTNSIYLDFVVEQLKLISLKGTKYMLVVDNMGISENKKLKEYLLSNSGYNTVISCGDLSSACSGNEQLINAIIGNINQFFIFSHSSSASSALWASVIGEYERIDETVANTRDRTEQTYSAASMYFPEPRQKSRTVTTSKRRDYVVPPERIASMRNNELYIKKANSQGTLHGYITR